MIERLKSIQSWLIMKIKTCRTRHVFFVIDYAESRLFQLEYVERGMFFYAEISCVLKGSIRDRPSLTPLKEVVCNRLFRFAQAIKMDGKKVVRDEFLEEEAKGSVLKFKVANRIK